MPKTEFILQGLTPKSHLEALRTLLDLPDIQSLLVGVAFVNEGGVRQLEELLEGKAARVIAFAGIRNDTTSYQGLVRLRRVVDELYAVDTGARACIFHPKLFLARGQTCARLLIGSANLTMAGLGRNIEAGVLLDFDLAEEGERALIDDIQRQFEAARTGFPYNIFEITEVAGLDDLLATGRLVDEMDALPSGDTDQMGERASNGSVSDPADNGNAVPRMKLKISPLRMEALKRRLIPSVTSGPTVPGIEVKEAEIVPAPVSDDKTESSADVSFVSTKRYRYYREGVRERAARLRREAKSRGETTYNTGLPCRFGHYADRFTCNGKCRECNRQDSERSNRLGLYR